MIFARCRKLLLALAVVAVVPGCAKNERARPAARPTPAARPAAAAPDTVAYMARGNEPFWAVCVTSAGIVFSEPDHADGVHGAYVAPTRQSAGLVFRTVLDDSAATPLELTLDEKPCSDGMSDRAYSYAAVVRVGERVLHGCAERGVAAATPSR